MILYDGLYTLAKDIPKQKHTHAPAEQLLFEVYHKYLKQGVQRKFRNGQRNLKN